MKNLFAALLIISFLVIPKPAQAGEMKTFLLSCAYGTMIGAAVGLASVAVSDDPSHHGQNIAKGASLGLYAGIGLGLYLNYGRSSSADTQDVEFKEISPMWLQADSHKGQIQGASVHWTTLQF